MPHSNNSVYCYLCFLTSWRTSSPVTMGTQNCRSVVFLFPFLIVIVLPVPEMTTVQSANMPPFRYTRRFFFCRNVGPAPELVRQREAKWIDIMGRWNHILLKKTSKVCGWKQSIGGLHVQNALDLVDEGLHLKPKGK